MLDAVAEMDEREGERVRGMTKYLLRMAPSQRPSTPHQVNRRMGNWTKSHRPHMEIETVHLCYTLNPSGTWTQGTRGTSNAALMLEDKDLQI